MGIYALSRGLHSYQLLLTVVIARRGEHIMVLFIIDYFTFKVAYLMGFLLLFIGNFILKYPILGARLLILGTQYLLLE